MCKKPTIRNNNNITTKKPNFTEAEDVALSKAYVSVTLDPIKGISQAKGDFWGKIKEVYDLFLTEFYSLNSRQLAYYKRFKVAQTMNDHNAAKFGLKNGRHL